MEQSNFLPVKVKWSLLAAAISASFSVNADDEKSGIEVIQVNAQKRVENIQEVPITISAFSENMLQNIGAESINDLGVYTPGLETNNATATQTTFNIRGITTNDFGIGLEPAVAVYIDGVYVGRRGTSNLNFNSIERVEVLKGPQGTLFGRNSAAGAVNIITKKPVEDTEGNLHLTIGNYGKSKMAADYNMALSDSLYWHSSVVKNYRDGYVDVAGSSKDIGNNNDISFRSDFLWTPSQHTEVLLRTDYSDLNQDSRPAATLNPAYGPGDPFGTVETDYHDNVEKRRTKGISLEVNHQLDDMLFTSITAWREFTRYNSMEDDGSAFDRAYFGSILDEDQKQFSQEFRLTGSTEKLKWTLGTTFFDEDIYQDTHANFLFQTLDGFALTNAGVNPAQIPDIQAGLGMAGVFSGIIPAEILFSIADPSIFSIEQVLGIIAISNYGQPFVELVNNRSQTESYAFYADATYSVTDKLDMTLGLRYSHDEKTFDILTNYRNQIDLAFPGYGAIPIGLAFSVPTDTQQKDQWSKLTPRVVLDYQWTPQIMTYLSYAEGFKSGGFNTLGFADPVKEETVSNLELGLKSLLLDNALKLNLSVFNYDYDDLQQHELDGPAGSVPTYNLRNVDAKGQGLELELQWQATDNLMLSANYGYLDTEYTQWGLFPWETELEANDNLLGEPISGMPKTNLFLALDYVTAVGENDLALHLDWAYTSERQTSIDGPALPTLPYDPASVQGLTSDNKIDAYGIANAKVTLTAASGDMRFSLFVENLFDKEYLLAIGGQAMAVGSPIANRGLPRMWGLSMDYSF